MTSLVNLDSELVVLLTFWAVVVVALVISTTAGELQRGRR